MEKITWEWRPKLSPATPAKHGTASLHTNTTLDTWVVTTIAEIQTMNPGSGATQLIQTKDGRCAMFHFVIETLIQWIKIPTEEEDLVKISQWKFYKKWKPMLETLIAPEAVSSVFLVLSAQTRCKSSSQEDATTMKEIQVQLKMI